MRKTEKLDIRKYGTYRMFLGSTIGRNASAGVVQLVSARLEMDTFVGKVTAGVGGHGLSETDGFLNVPISENTAGNVRISADIRCISEL